METWRQNTRDCRFVFFLFFFLFCLFVVLGFLYSVRELSLKGTRGLYTRNCKMLLSCLCGLFKRFMQQLASPLSMWLSVKWKQLHFHHFNLSHLSNCYFFLFFLSFVLFFQPLILSSLVLTQTLRALFMICTDVQMYPYRVLSTL